MIESSCCCRRVLWSLLLLGTFIGWSPRLTVVAAQDSSETESLESESSTLGATDEISVNMPNMNITDALRLMAQSMGLNLAIDKNVTGVVDMLLQRVPAQDAWNSLLKSAGLSVEQDGDVVRVFARPAEAEPPKAVETRVVRLKHIALGATTLSGANRTGGFSSTSGDGTYQGLGGFTNTRSNRDDRALSTPGSTSPIDQEPSAIDEILRSTFEERDLKIAKDVRSNQLILTGAPELVEEALGLIEALDIPVPQVLIQAQIVQVRSQAVKQLGIDWGGVYTASNSGSFQLDNERSRAESSNALSGAFTQNLALAGELSEFQVTLSALVDKGDAQVLFSPRVSTQNNKEAFITSGQEIQVPSGLDINGNATFRERQVTLELGVTPQVMDDNLIALVIRVRNDQINFEQPEISGVPPLDVSAVESYVALRDSDTVVIGGILSTQRNNSVKRIPFLSDVPLLGRAFRHSNKRTDQTELIILITPTIISDETGAPSVDRYSVIKPNPEQQQTLERLSEKVHRDEK